TEARDEEPDGQHLKREDHAVRAALHSQRPEEKAATLLGVLEHRVDPVADPLKDLAEIRLEHQQRERNLQSHSPRDEPELDRAAICGEQERDPQDYRETEEPRESRHLADDFQNKLALIRLLA